MGKLDGKIAIVTGGTSGIGLATAKKFVEEAAFLFITGRGQEDLDAAVKFLGEHAHGVQGDVAKLADLDYLYEIVKATKGRVDIVFANAGIANQNAPLGSITEDQYDRNFDINVKGLLFTVQKALPLVVDGGSVFLNASTTASTGTPAFSVYSASKAAVRSFARTWISDACSSRFDPTAHLVLPQPPQKLGYRDLCAEAAWKLAALLPPQPDRFRPIVTVGQAAEEIVRVARAQGADLIIMGTRGSRGLRHWLRRSVPDEVRRQAPVAVMTVEPHRRCLEGDGDLEALFPALVSMKPWRPGAASMVTRS